MAYITKNRLHILMWLDKPCMEAQFTASGLERDVNKLIQLGWIERCEDETVKDQFGYPARALRRTEAGTAALYTKLPKKRL